MTAIILPDVTGHYESWLIAPRWDPHGMVAWAVEQVDDTDPDRCLAQLDDIVRNKPPGEEQPQLMRCIIGGPDVLYDGEDAALRRIYQVSGDLIEARKIAGLRKLASGDDPKRWRSEPGGSSRCSTQMEAYTNGQSN